MSKIYWVCFNFRLPRFPNHMSFQGSRTERFANASSLSTISWNNSVCILGSFETSWTIKKGWHWSMVVYGCWSKFFHAVDILELIPCSGPLANYHGENWRVQTKMKFYDGRKMFEAGMPWKNSSPIAPNDNSPLSCNTWMVSHINQFRITLMFIIASIMPVNSTTLIPLNRLIGIHPNHIVAPPKLIVINEWKKLHQSKLQRMVAPLPMINDERGNQPWNV